MGITLGVNIAGMQVPVGMTYHMVDIFIIVVFDTLCCLN